MKSTNNEQIARSIRAHSNRLTVVHDELYGVWTILPTEHYRRHCTYDDDVRLMFEVTIDGRPRVLLVENYSVHAGWGTEMVLALAAAFPGVTSWDATEVKDSGIAFWLTMQERYGITISSMQPPERFAARLARAQRAMGDPQAFRPTRDGSTLADLDAALDRGSARGVIGWLRRVLRPGGGTPK